MWKIRDAPPGAKKVPSNFQSRPAIHNCDGDCSRASADIQSIFLREAKGEAFGAHQGSTTYFFSPAACCVPPRDEIVYRFPPRRLSMLIFSQCPHCQAEHELTPKLLGDKVNCQRCYRAFVVAEMEKKTDDGPDDAPIALQSAFTAGRSSKTDSPLAGARSRPKDGKRSLRLPPPPTERWSPRANDEDAAGQRFPEFQHDSKALRRFTKRERLVNDHSWLMAVGFFLTTVVVFGFLLWLVFLLARR
jgi:hypothetical protein